MAEVPDIMGPAEIQARLGISRQRTYIAINRRGFPEPRWRLKMGNVWLAADVEEWIRQHRPELLKG